MLVMLNDNSMMRSQTRDVLHCLITEEKYAHDITFLRFLCIIVPFQSYVLKAFDALVKGSAPEMSIVISLQTSFAGKF